MKVEHYFFLFSPQNKLRCSKNNIYSPLFTVFYLSQTFYRQTISFEFKKQDSLLPIVFYAPYVVQPSQVDCDVREERQRFEKCRNVSSICLSVTKQSTLIKGSIQHPISPFFDACIFNLEEENS